MDWQTTWDSPFSLFLVSFASLIGDKRTRATFAAILYGIIATGSTVCEQIGAHAPLLATAKRRGQRVIRFCCGTTTTRSALNDVQLTARLREFAARMDDFGRELLNAIENAAMISPPSPQQTEEIRRRTF